MSPPARRRLSAPRPACNKRAKRADARPAATVEDVRLLRQTVGEKLGVKASGGIRTLDEALAMIEAGASRLGTSSTSAILAELRKRRGED